MVTALEALKSRTSGIALRHRLPSYKYWVNGYQTLGGNSTTNMLSNYSSFIELPSSRFPPRLTSQSLPLASLTMLGDHAYSLLFFTVFQYCLNTDSSSPCTLARQSIAQSSLRMVLSVALHIPV
eukprot:2884247-Pleurochrysis_carterae.AAC.1